MDLVAIPEDNEAEYQDVTPDVPHIDALSAMCVLQPREPDVIDASNLLRDSPSDLAAERRATGWPTVLLDEQDRVILHHPDGRIELR